MLCPFTHMSKSLEGKLDYSNKSNDSSMATADRAILIYNPRKQYMDLRCNRQWGSDTEKPVVWKQQFINDLSVLYYTSVLNFESQNDNLKHPNRHTFPKIFKTLNWVISFTSSEDSLKATGLKWKRNCGLDKLFPKAPVSYLAGLLCRQGQFMQESITSDAQNMWRHFYYYQMSKPIWNRHN